MPDFGAHPAGVGGMGAAIVFKTMWTGALVAVMWPALAAGTPVITAQEYEAFMSWKEGREDPRLEKDTDAAKLKKIARQLGVSTTALKAIIDKVEPVAATLKEETERSLARALEDTPVKGRVLVIEVNADSGHVVAGVKWRCPADERDVDKEASYVAWALIDGGKIVKTLGLWCVNEIDTKLFSAKIGRVAFERIQRPSIDRFATSRFLRLFEEVKRGPHE